MNELNCLLLQTNPTLNILGLLLHYECFYAVRNHGYKLKKYIS